MTSEIQYAKNKSGSTLTASWAKHGDAFVAELRCGDASRSQNFANLLGKVVVIKSKAGKTDHVRLTAVAHDFGSGDVTLFAVERL